ncbi:hypothetical protein K9L16_03985 [Candidatus Pacearchaeota archaeon]|nr:hypothetical protein [Candidatus Pacearchaeota archaeon]
MNKLSRSISGVGLAFLSIWFIFFLGFIDGPGIDFFAILLGIFLLILAFVIFFNKKEDEIEKIKKQ